jgi:hypothetical protein
MNRLWIASLLLLTGCRSVVGPFEPRKPERVDDPNLTIAEQRQRGRDRLALPEPSPTLVPPTYGEAGWSYGR